MESILGFLKSLNIRALHIPSIPLSWSFFPLSVQEDSCLVRRVRGGEGGVTIEALLEKTILYNFLISPAVLEPAGDNIAVSWRAGN